MPPRPRGEADARTRTGDPFITRKVQARKARVMTGVCGHVFLQIDGFVATARAGVWTRVDELMYPSRTPTDTSVTSIGRGTSIGAAVRDREDSNPRPPT